MAPTQFGIVAPDRGPTEELRVQEAQRQLAQRDPDDQADQCKGYLGRVVYSPFRSFDFTATSENPHNSDFLSTAMPLAGMPRLIYIAPAHDDAV